MCASPKYATPSLKIGFEVLKQLIDKGSSQGVSQIAKATGLSKATVFRLLGAFQQLGYVEQHTKTRRYTLSPEIFGFFHYITSHFQPSDKAAAQVRESAHKLGCSVYLSMLAGRYSFVICASGIYGDTQVLGTCGPAYATSCGKSLVSQLDETLWSDYAPQKSDKAITKNTNLDPKKFFEELRLARQEGVAWNECESAPVVCSVATPIIEAGRTPRLAVALLYPYKEWILQNREDLASTAKRLSTQLALAITPVLR